MDQYNNVYKGFVEKGVDRKGLILRQSKTPIQGKREETRSREDGQKNKIKRANRACFLSVLLAC